MNSYFQEYLCVILRREKVYIELLKLNAPASILSFQDKLVNQSFLKWFFKTRLKNIIKGFYYDKIY